MSLRKLPLNLVDTQRGGVARSELVRRVATKLPTHAVSREFCLPRVQLASTRATAVAPPDVQYRPRLHSFHSSSVMGVIPSPAPGPPPSTHERARPAAGS